MKKIFTILSLAAAFSMGMQAQTLLVNDFENGDGGAYVAVDGTCEVIDNPATDGINNSAKALQINSTNFAQVGFPVNLPEGRTLANYTAVRFQALVLPGNSNTSWIGFNVGVSQDYETMDLIDPTNGNGAAWGDCVENTWIEVELAFNEDLLNQFLATYTSDVRNVMIKLGRAEFVYAVDNIRLVEKEMLDDPNTIFTFETMDLGPNTRCGMPWSGSCEVVENPYTNGINTSAKCLEVNGVECSPVTLAGALPEGHTWNDYTGVKFDLCIISGDDVAWAGIECGVRQDSGNHVKFGGAYDDAGGETAAYGDALQGTWQEITLTFNTNLYADAINENASVPTLYLRLMKNNLTYLIDNITLTSESGAVTTITNNTQKAAQIYGMQKAVVINANEALAVNVYGIDGKLVAARKLQAGHHEIALEAGIYIVNGKKVVVY